VTESGQLLAQTLGTLTSYDLGSGRRQWQAGTSEPAYRLRTSSGLVLLRPWAIGPGQPSTTAVDLATGVVRWRHPGSVMTIAGSSALLAVSGVRTLSTAGRRIEGPVESIDPDSGRTLWRVDVPSTAVLLGVPGSDGSPPRMLLVHDNRTLALHDLTTGAELAAAPLPPADYGPDNPSVAGGLIMLRHFAGWGSEISAYDPMTLELRWQRPASGAFDVQPCGGLACLASPAGIEALDPADGSIRWFQRGWGALEQRGPMLLAYSAAGGNEPVGIVEPNTGRVLVDLHGWRPLSSTGTLDHLLVTKAVPAGARTIVAVAGPRNGVPRLLVDLPAGTGDCQAVPGRLICRSTTGELNVWAYRTKG
jgi:outer membrane protein assembly factor BamB